MVTHPESGPLIRLGGYPTPGRPGDRRTITVHAFELEGIYFFVPFVLYVIKHSHKKHEGQKWNFSLPLETKIVRNIFPQVALSTSQIEAAGIPSDSSAYRYKRIINRRTRRKM
jgi:hypothetical protein